MDFCLENDIRHITRDSLQDAKAGNINNALKFATGEFCFILDPDHVPHPDLLDKIIPQFNDPEIGFIQIVQGYYLLFELLPYSSFHYWLVGM